MENKTFQFVMDEKAHRHLKRRSKEMGATIGVFIESMMAALELRVKRAYDVAGIDPAIHDLDEKFIRAIFEADKAGVSDAALMEDLKDIGQGAMDTEWTPEIKL